MEAIYSSETSVAFHYMPEDRTLHNHRRKNLKLKGRAVSVLK
jgi:hypothetical protein